MQPLPAAHSGDASPQSQLLAKGEPPMPSPWTNPTIIRRPTIAVLSAAALLVACDQPAGPSRPGGGILADAQAGTVSAHGNGQVALTEVCGFVVAGVCSGGGQGAQF